uniref:Uncharacterized protein n=1 Tax=Leptobrachium leishanense TaxID=445787 RepID=A0A8C5LYV5_9ANUR
MEDKLSQTAEPESSDGASTTSPSPSSSGSETLSDGDPKTSPGGSSTDSGAPQRREDGGGGEEEDEELDNILSPPPMQSRKCSNPEVSLRVGKSVKYKKQLSEDGRLLRRGSLGGALTGRYLLPAGAAQSGWQATTEASNLVRMRSQALGQSAPSLTASLKEKKFYRNDYKYYRCAFIFEDLFVQILVDEPRTRSHKWTSERMSQKINRTKTLFVCTLGCTDRIIAQFAVALH